MPLGAYIWRDSDILRLDLKVFDEILTIRNQKTICAGNSNFEVLQFEAGVDVACFLAMLIAISGRPATTQV